MKSFAKIALTIPNQEDPDRHFQLRLKQTLQNEPCEYPQPEKIFAVSDIEGNFIAFSQLLYNNNVIDKYLKWTFGEGHLVITGDCFDRGEQVMECLWLIYSLEEKARKKGGYVHFILGNHEIMNMNGDWRYVHPKYAKSSTTSYTALYYGNNELWRWLCTKNIMEVIGNTLFVHGGISEELLNLKLSVTAINNRVRPNYAQSNQHFTDPLNKLIFNSEHSPFWYRGYYSLQLRQEVIEATLKHFEVSTIVTGHTVVEHISSYYNGKVINLDTDHANGRSEALLITNNIFYRADKAGKKTKIK